MAMALAGNPLLEAQFERLANADPAEVAALSNVSAAIMKRLAAGALACIPLPCWVKLCVGHRECTEQVERQLLFCFSELCRKASCFLTCNGQLIPKPWGGGSHMTSRTWTWPPRPA